MRTYPLAPCDPFDPNRLYGDEKYNLQNMLLKAVNMPPEAYLDEEVFEVWDDRHPAFWQHAKAVIESKMGDDAYFAGASDASFLRWASVVFSQIEEKEVKLTGASLVRYTNQSTGYPTLRLTGIIVTHAETHKYGHAEPRDAWRLVDF